MSNLKSADYILPLQVTQFLEAFSHAGIYDIDLIMTLEKILIDQMEYATGPQLVKCFKVHQKWAKHMVI